MLSASCVKGNGGVRKFVDERGQQGIDGIRLAVVSDMDGLPDPQEFPRGLGRTLQRDHSGV